MQVSPSQQPLQVEESQTQEPPTQRVPGPHGAPLKPQEQEPSRQRSAVVGLQLEQVWPPKPHAVTVIEVTQVWPEQQPLQV
jgi:hypothetical protein